MKFALGGVPETLVMPLWGRAMETMRSDAIVRDEWALKMMPQLAYDFSKFDDDWLLQLKIAIRTKLFDDLTRDFIACHPKAVIINLGAGLDNRFERVDNGQINWFDLDLPETIALRRTFFPSHPRRPMLATSMFKQDWPKQIKPEGQPILILAEGVLPYFDAAELRAFFVWLVAEFPGGQMVLQATTPYQVERNRRNAKDRFKQAKLKWGIRSGKEMLAWDPGLILEGEWAYSEFYRSRWKGWWWWTTVSTYLAGRYQNRVIHLRFKQKQSD